MKVLKKPRIIEARRLIKDEQVITAHGPVLAKAGDYVLTDPETSDTWPIRESLFNETYEVLDE